MDALTLGGPLSAVLSVVSNPKLCGMVHLSSDCTRTESNGYYTWNYKIPWVWKLGIGVSSFQTINIIPTNQTYLTLPISPYVMFKCPKSNVYVGVKLAFDMVTSNRIANQFSISSTSITWSMIAEDHADSNALLIFFNWD